VRDIGLQRGLHGRGLGNCVDNLNIVQQKGTKAELERIGYDLKELSSDIEHRRSSL